MVREVYLKLPRRIESLMMVIALTLLVYNVGQYTMQEQLKEQQTTLPNQLGKRVNHPTLRWVFQILEGIGVIYLNNSSIGQLEENYISNMNPLQEKIIRLFGASATCIYGIDVQKTAA